MGQRLDKKLYRLDQLEQILLDSHPNGLIKAQIARRIDIHPSEVPTYLADLGRRMPVYEPMPGRYAIDRDACKFRLELTQHEAMVVHLAARLLTTCTDKYNPHAATLLRKLARALTGFAPLISQHVSRSAEVLDDASRRRDPIFMQILETLTGAWSLRKKVWLTHEMEDGKIYEYEFSPYFIEPYAAGRAIHVIGVRKSPDRLETAGKLRTFKIERLRTIKLLDATYTIPPDFDPRNKLKDAWGIWYTEKEPIEVVLRFSRQVAHRIRETQWHHTEKIEEQEDGSLIWRAQIAGWFEMLSWIKGWGSGCIVLAPDDLRLAVAEDMAKAARNYGGE